MIAKSLSRLILGIVFLHFAPALLQAQLDKRDSLVRVQTSEDSALPEAVVLSVQGDCEFSDDGVDGFGKP